MHVCNKGYVWFCCWFCCAHFWYFEKFVSQTHACSGYLAVDPDAYIHPRSLFWRFGKTEKSEHHNTLFKGIIQNMCNNILCKKNRKKIISNRIFAATSRKCRQGTHTHRLARRRRQKEMTRTDTVDASRCRHYTTLYFTDWKYKMTVSIKPSRSLWEFIFLFYVLMQYLH